jgi:hypothetical protein
VGPLPAAVYWRRRWVALASVVTVAGLLTHRRPRRAHGRNDGRPRPRSGALDRGAAADRLDRPGRRRRHRERGTDGAGECRPNSARRRPSGPVPAGSAGTVQPGLGQPGAMTAVPPSPGPMAAASVPSSTASSERIRPDDSPRPTSRRSRRSVPRTGPVPARTPCSRRAEVESGRAQGRQPPGPPPGDHQCQRPAVRPGPRRRPAGDRRLERRRRTRLWSSNDCINNPTVDLAPWYPAVPVAFASPGGSAPRRRGARSRARSCPPVRTG